jgi:hypothetical protein
MCSAEIPTGANRVHPEQGQVLGTEGMYGKNFIILIIHFMPFYAMARDQHIYKLLYFYIRHV